MAERPFFITAAKGTEGALRDELRELRTPQVRADRGGVHFGGTFRHAARVCLHSRIGMRVLWRRASFHAEDGEALYEGASSVDWSEVLDPKKTLSVAATVSNGTMRHSGFVAQKVKDAIVDQQREHFGVRPNVERRDPDVRVQVRIARDQAELFVDLSGEPLHRRGYRRQAGGAPIKETLAAALLRLSGWDRQRTLIDPLCGSGTIAIEGALWAANIAPGLTRKRFGFQRWVRFDDTQRNDLKELREHARDTAKRPEVQVLGSDRDPDMVRLAERLAREAGARVRWERADVRDLSRPGEQGHVMTNPPYGLRLDTSERFEAQLSKALRGLAGHRVSLITPERSLAKAMRLKPVQEHQVFNGDLDCRLFSWDIP